MHPVVGFCVTLAPPPNMFIILLLNRLSLLPTLLSACEFIDHIKLLFSQVLNLIKDALH